MVALDDGAWAFDKLASVIHIGFFKGAGATTPLPGFVPLLAVAKDGALRSRQVLYPHFRTRPPAAAAS